MKIKMAYGSLAYSISAFVIVCTLLYCNKSEPIISVRPVIATKKCKELMRKHGITTLVTDHEKNEVYFIREGRKIILKTDACKDGQPEL